jgi:hypothetical protein
VLGGSFHLPGKKLLNIYTMKNLLSIISGLFIIVSFISCSTRVYHSNGEMIYRTGKNQSGETMLDKKRSSISIFKSCQSCHGPKGDRMGKTSIAFSSLSDPGMYSSPYTETLVIRFLDEDLKSDGHKANIGVRWKMTEEDKKDLIAFLKTLQ